MSDSELLALKDLVKALKPVKLGAEALCRQDSNLYTAGKVFCFVLGQLQSYVLALKARILGIRNPNLIPLMEYLNKPSFLLSGTLDAFGVKPKKSAVISLAKDL